MTVTAVHWSSLLFLFSEVLLFSRSLKMPQERCRFLAGLQQLRRHRAARSRTLVSSSTKAASIAVRVMPLISHREAERARCPVVFLRERRAEEGWIVGIDADPYAGIVELPQRGLARSGKNLERDVGAGADFEHRA